MSTVAAIGRWFRRGLRCQFYSEQWGRQCERVLGHDGPHGAL